MSDLSFKVNVDYSELMRMRNEMQKLQEQMLKFPVNPTAAQQADLARLESRMKFLSERYAPMNAQAQKAWGDTQAMIHNRTRAISYDINSLIGTLSQPLGGAVGLLGMAGLGGLLEKMASVHGQFQQMKSQITTLVGETKGENLFGQLKEFAKISPLTYQATVGEAQRMLGFGIDSNKVMPFLKAISDVSMGDTNRFRSLSLAFSQMSAAGKLMGQDLNQMVNAGFQPLQIMSEKTGKSIGQLKDEMSKGKITAEMVQQAFIDATSAGGKYFNMSVNASKTIPGAMSMLEDAIDAMFDDMGTNAEGAILKIINGATKIVDNYKIIAPTLLGAVSAFGLYKAVAIASVNAEQRANEEKSQAIIRAYDEEMQKYREKEAEKKALAGISATPTDPNEFKQGARYKKSVTDSLLGNGIPDGYESMDDAKQVYADYSNQIKDRQTEIDQRKENIRLANEEIATLKKKIEALDEEEEDSKKRGDYDANKDVFEGRRERWTAKLTEKESEIQSNETDLSDFTSQLDELVQKRDELAKPIDLAEAMDGSGSINDLKARLEALKDLRDSASPQELAGELGQQIEEQISGIEAALQGVVNLDSDLKQSVSAGEYSEENAQALQRLRNAEEDETGATLRNSVAHQVNSSTQRDNAVARQGSGGATRSESVATEQNSAVVTKNTILTKINAQGKKVWAQVCHVGKAAGNGFTQMLNGIKAAWATNPIGLIITGISMAAGLIGSFWVKENEAEKEANRFSDATAKTVRDVQSLYAVMENTNKDSQTHKSAVEDLTKIAKDYGLVIKDELDIYTQLIAKKERLIALIVEEGKQKQIAANIEEYQNKQAKNANDFTADIKDYIENAMNTDFAQSYADIIATSVSVNAEKIGQLKAEYDGLVNKAGQANGNNARQLWDKAKEVEKQINDLAYGDARKAAANNGETLKLGYQGIFGKGQEWEDSKYAGAISKYASEINNVNKNLATYTKNAAESAHATEGYKDEIEKVDYKKMDATNLSKEMEKTITNMKNAKDEVKKLKKTDDTAYKSSVSSAKKTKKSDDSLIATETKKTYEKVVKAVKAVNTPIANPFEKLNKGAKEFNITSKDISKTKIGPKEAETKAIDTAKEGLKDAKGAQEDVNNTTSVVNVDSIQADEASDKAKGVVDSMNEINATQAAPTIITDSIDQAIAKVQLLTINIKKANNQAINGFLTPEEAKELNELKQKMVTTSKGQKGFTGPDATKQLERYNFLMRRAESRTKFNFEGEILSMTEENARIIQALIKENPQAIRVRNGKKVLIKNLMTKESQDIYNGMHNSLHNEKVRDDYKKQRQEFNKQLDGFDYQISHAGSNEELSTIKSNISKMKSKFLAGSPEYRRLERLEKIADRRINPPKKNWDSAQEKYDLNKTKEEQAKERKQQIEETEQEKIDNEIDLMPEGFVKRLAEMENERNKAIKKANKEVEDRLKKFKDDDRNIWKKQNGHKLKDGKYVSTTDADWDANYKSRKRKKVDTYEEYVAKMEKEGKGDDVKTKTEYYETLDLANADKSSLEAIARDMLGTVDNIQDATDEYNKKMQEILKEQASSFTELLNQYGSYNAKLESLKRKRDADIQVAKDSGDTTAEIKANLEYNQAVKDLESEKLMKGIDWETTFGEYEKYSDEFLESAKENLRNFLEENKLKLKVEDIDRITEQMNNITQTQRGRKEHLIGTWIQNPIFDQYIKNRERKEARDDAQKRYDESQTAQTNAENSLLATKDNIATAIKDAGVQFEGEINSENIGEIEKAFALSKITLPDELKKNFTNLIEGERDVEGKKEKTGAAWKALDALKGAGPKLSPFQATNAIINGVNDNLKSFGETMTLLGIQNTTFGKGMGKFIESSQFATDAFNAFKKGDFVGVANNLVKALGSLGEAFGSWGIAGFGSSDRTLADDLQKLRESQDALRHAMSELKEEMQKVSFSDASKLYEKQAQLQSENTKNMSSAIQRSASAYNNGFIGVGGKSSANKKIDSKMTKEDWDALSAAAGTSIRKASDFFALSSKKMHEVSVGASTQFRLIKKYATEGFQDASEFLDSYVELWKEKEEIDKAYMNKVTSTSYESIVEGFRSMISDLNNDWSKFTNNVNQMLFNAILNAMVSDIYAKRLEEWQKKFHKALSENSDGGKELTATEAEILRAEYEQTAQEAQEKIKQLREAAGLNDSASRSATVGSIQNVTQEQATEISGRITAIAETSEMKRLLQETGNQLLTSISESTLKSAMNSDIVVSQITSLSDQLASCLIGINQISNNTSEITAPIKKLYNDMHLMYEYIVTKRSLE